MFSKSRLTIARQRRSLTMRDLARLVEVEPRAITGYEAGEYAPTEDVLVKLSNVLSFPISYFEGDDIDIAEASGVSFRSMSKMTAKQRDRAIASGSIAFLLSDWLDSEFNLPSSDIPDMREDSPETAAFGLRQHWGLGTRPIKNLVHLLELKGARVFSLGEDGNEIDAYSLWRTRRPFVFLNQQKTAERSRFDAAHELGHLVLHRHAAPNGHEAEREANAFAGAFLMPEPALRAEGRVSGLPKVVELKQKWAVSVAAMTYRLFEINLISKWTYQQLFMEISQRGWRTQEPYSGRHEQSQVWRKVLDSLRANGEGYEYLAEMLKLPTSEITKLLFGLAAVPVSSEAPKVSTPRRGNLRLVR